MLSKTSSATLCGVDAEAVEIEAQIFSALRKFTIIGLPDSVLRESKERIRCAIENSGFEFPKSEVIVSLAPASLPKRGAGFDLAIALSILAADGLIDQGPLSEFVVLGELSLDGNLKYTKGVLAAACLAQQRVGASLIAPLANSAQAAAVSGVKAYVASNLVDVVSFLCGLDKLPLAAELAEEGCVPSVEGGPDLGEVIGQSAAKRALEISAAGGHNLLMVGPPGAGKSMLAERLPGILPPLSRVEQIELSKIYDAQGSRNGTGLDGFSLPVKRPFRAPHHSCSTAGLLGGGRPIVPGELSLAHKGVLFLDEFNEFRREVVESLRQPLESKRILLSRAVERTVLPADFLLLAAMNPCPCGLHGSGKGLCQCSAASINRHRQRISAPLLDRIDLQIWLAANKPEDLLNQEVQSAESAKVAERVLSARAIQQKRFSSLGATNSQMNTAEAARACNLSQKDRELLTSAAQKYSMSTRAYGKTLKTARTIADLEGSERVCSSHLAEALSYRIDNLNN